jgi:rubredoxin
VSNGAGSRATPAAGGSDKRGDTMPSWKCSNCGYTFEANSHPDQCPSCKQKCEFLDNTCYTPDCAAQGVDPRIAKPKP